MGVPPTRKKGRHLILMHPLRPRKARETGGKLQLAESAANTSKTAYFYAQIIVVEFFFSFRCGNYL